MKNITGSLRSRLNKLAAFLPVLEAEGIGNWTKPSTQADGSIELPYFLFSRSAKDLIKLCYSDRWVLKRFDWSEWKRTEECTNLISKSKLLAHASADQLSKLLTCLIRQERFSEGTLYEAYKTGLLLGILSRAQTRANDSS